jgi:hypothetical protein
MRYVSRSTARLLPVYGRGPPCGVRNGPPVFQGLYVMCEGDGTLVSNP